MMMMMMMMMMMIGQGVNPDYRSRSGWWWVPLNDGWWYRWRSEWFIPITHYLLWCLYGYVWMMIYSEHVRTSTLVWHVLWTRSTAYNGCLFCLRLGSEGVRPTAKYGPVSEAIRHVIPEKRTCKSFCGGKKCKYCNVDNVGKWKPEQMEVDGVYSNWSVH